MSNEHDEDVKLVEGDAPAHEVAPAFEPPAHEDDVHAPTADEHDAPKTDAFEPTAEHDEAYADKVEVGAPLDPTVAPPVIDPSDPSVNNPTWDKNPNLIADREFKTELNSQED